MEKLHAKIDAYVDKKNIPNFIFYGDYLCGKENLCDYLIQKIYEPSRQKEIFVKNQLCFYQRYQND